MTRGGFVLKSFFTLAIATFLASCATTHPNLESRQVASTMTTPLPRYWVTLAPHDEYLVRAFADNNQCPQVEADGVKVKVQMREQKDWRSVCQWNFSRDARSATIDGTPLPLAPHTQQSVNDILIIGDTGCRLDKRIMQDCSKGWVFAQLAETAKRSRPQIVIHLGDYFYREACKAGSPCTDAQIGDREKIWREELMASAKDLLEAAPWVILRGNHENCERNWRGWNQYLSVFDSDNSGCTDVEPHYTIRFKNLRLVVVDSAEVPDKPFIEGKTDPKFRPNKNYMENRESYFDSFGKILENPSGTSTWVVTHKPFWGIRKYAEDNVDYFTPDLWEAYRKLEPNQSLLERANIAAFISGHIHTFQVLNFVKKGVMNYPPQIVVGNSGTSLDSGLPDIDGA